MLASGIMAWPKGKPRSPSLPTWREIRLRLPLSTVAALKALSRGYSERTGHHLGVPIVVAKLLTERYAPEALDEIRAALTIGVKPSVSSVSNPEVP